MQRMSMAKYLEQENIQISRIFRLMDPNVDIIYVTPYRIQDDLLNYYLKVSRHLVGVTELV